MTEADKALLAVGILLVGAFLLLGIGVAFGADLACTNHYSCTMAWCPAACDRIKVALWANVVGQLALLVPVARGRTQVKATACALSVLLALACWALMNSYALAAAKPSG